MSESTAKSLQQKYRHLADIGDNVQPDIAKIYYGITIHIGGVPQRQYKKWNKRGRKLEAPPQQMGFTIFFAFQ